MLGLMAPHCYGISKEIADFMGFVASPQAAYVIGASLSISGEFGA